MITIFCCSSSFSVTVGDSIGFASSTATVVSIVGFSSIVISSVFVVVVVTSSNCKKIQFREYSKYSYWEKAALRF
jgi:hypothetical protein